MAYSFANKQQQPMTRASSARPASVRPSLRPPAVPLRRAARIVTAIRAQASHIHPHTVAPDSPRQHRSSAATTRASAAAPMASVASSPILQSSQRENFLYQSMTGRGARIPHDLLNMAGEAVMSIPHALGATGGRLAADASGVRDAIAYNISTIKSLIFGRQELVILPLDTGTAAAEEEATDLSVAIAATELLEVNDKGALVSPLLSLPSAAVGAPAPAPAPAPAATSPSLSPIDMDADNTEAVLSLELRAAAATGVPVPGANPLTHAATAASDAEACATALRQLEANGRILYRMDQYVQHALASMSQGRILRLVVVRGRATLHRLAPAVCELAGMYGCVVVLGEEQGQQLMGGVLDMPAVYSGHVESNKWEVLSCPSELQLHLKVPGRVHVVYGDKVLDMRREANRQGYCMSKYGTWCAAADPSPSAPWWDVSHVDHHHEPLLRQRMGEWF